MNDEKNTPAAIAAKTITDAVFSGMTLKYISAAETSNAASTVSKEKNDPKNMPFIFIISPIYLSLSFIHYMKKTEC